MAAVQAGDVKTLAGLVEHTRVECWAGSPGAGGPPSCEALGVEPGTWVETLPVASCEGSFTPKADVPLALGWLLGAERGDLRFVGLFVPARHPFGSAYATPERGLVFAGPDGSGYRTVYLRADRIVMVMAGCGRQRPPAALVERWLVGP